LNPSQREVLLRTLAAVPALTGTSVFSEAAARVATSWQLPRKRAVRVVENEWITMSDGVRLAARPWIPEGVEQSPVPVVLEYIPYRKRDAKTCRSRVS
jgi:predicted acyl esterase